MTTAIFHSRFGQCLAFHTENRRAPRYKIFYGFTDFNKIATISRKDPPVWRMPVSESLEHLMGALRGRALAIKHLSPVALGYRESFCE